MTLVLLMLFAGAVAIQPHARREVDRVSLLDQLVAQRTQQVRFAASRIAKDQHILSPL